ncbi:MAG: hypothetical protein N2049_10770 [Anaerolineales bacterium]|nr:hypothetical protein [Anaerolineales bacterium]MCX7609684.1 hypothetical protein [Anaerolineales bacterium]MDW8226887.1 hypothetical protein [Anaerolineales bacterium]
MNVGMLWFDNEKIPLTVKVERAAEYYRRKYGLTPDLCLVHPSMLQGTQAEVIQSRLGQVTVRPYRSILPGHLWIGVEEQNR